MSDLRAIGELPLRLPQVQEVLAEAKTVAANTLQNLTPGIETGKLGSPGTTSGAVREQQGIPFSQYFADALSSANQKQFEATDAARAFADGTRDDIHGTMLAIKEAEIELKLVSNVRTKLVEAWNDLWRMNV